MKVELKYVGQRRYSMLGQVTSNCGQESNHSVTNAFKKIVKL